MERCLRHNFTYEAEKEPLDLDKDKIMGIDPGVNNFATIVTTEGPHVQLWTGEN